MRRRLTYANVAATMALVFSMSGGALAANHYLISSTKQINPKVLKKLKGATGKTGSAGKEGSPGKEGAPGKEGPKGVEGQTGPSHAYSADGGTNAKVSVPAGDYAVTATGVFFNSGAKAGGGECILQGGETHQERWATVPNTGEEEGRSSEVYGAATITNTGTVVLKTPGTISETCGNSRESQSPVNAAEVQLTAVLVGAVN